MLKPVLVPSLLCLSGSIIKILFVINLGNSITIPLVWHLTTMKWWPTIIYSKQHNTVQIIHYSYPESNPLEVHIGLPHPSALLTKCTQVLMQMQASGWSLDLLFRSFDFFYFMTKPVFKRIRSTFPCLKNFCYCIVSHNIVVNVLTVLELYLVSVLCQSVASSRSVFPPLE